MRIDPDTLERSLPSREVFPATMPRYPNLWFLVDDRLALRGRYKYAVEYVVRALEQQLGMHDDFLTGIGNHMACHWLNPAREGSDFQMRAGPFHCYTDAEHDEYSHRHQVHARFYVTPFLDQDGDSIEIPDRPDRRYLMVPASVHYEVATEDPAHPYVDTCPLCGITGDYAGPIKAGSQDYCLKIHDPLGVEFVLHGTVRGQAFAEDRPRPVSSLSEISECSTDSEWEYIEFAPRFLEPAKLGCAIVSPRS